MITGNPNKERRQEGKDFAIYSHRLKESRRMRLPLTELFADEDGMDVLSAEEKQSAHGFRYRDCVLLLKENLKTLTF